ncbi:carboxylesterase/lipase family protein [Nostocoides vanveenii]|uniref:Carboxylic ester hydrolase n=1 Tax=Nostocoides vanveenii TaxID=330835 RepID=A0ABN2JZY5_9MICO
MTVIRTRVTTGSIEGQETGGVAVFTGIPYATIPARFAAPAPAPAWDGVRPARTFGPPPPQAGGLGPSAETGDEADWLTANVWSPDLTGALPVLVWIHGGGYLFGRSDLPEYDGATLARDGAVVVTINYRVGFEGFGLLDDMPPNRGLLDQIAALEWVRDNIAAFGGDPGRVTVFGQSAGGGSIAALLAMPRAAGLFHRAIVQSMPGAYLTRALAANVTRTCAAEIGCAPSDLSTTESSLLAAAVDAVLAGIDRYAARWGPAAHAGIPFAPVIDGDVLPATPWQGVTGRVDLLIGHTRHEQRLFSALTGRLGQITVDEANESTRVFAPDPAAYARHFPNPEERFDVVRSDWLFRMPSLKLAEAQVAAGGRCHLYELTWPAPGMGGALGACHGLDVPLVFGNLTAGQTALLIGEPTQESYAVSAQMRTAWLAFARDGDPGWPDFATGATRLFDVEAEVTAYPEVVSRAIWTHAPAVLDLT